MIFLQDAFVLRANERLPISANLYGTPFMNKRLKTAQVTHARGTSKWQNIVLCRDPRGVLPYKGLMGTFGKPGYVFRDFCLKQGIEFIIFCLNQGIDLTIFVLNRISFLLRWTAKFLQALMLINIDFHWLKQGIKNNRNSVLNRVGKSAIFVLNRVRVWGATPHLPTQRFFEYPPGP